MLVCAFYHSLGHGYFCKVATHKNKDVSIILTSKGGVLK
jgi:hypothetical protein